jgi:hypothetical protein
MDKHKLKAIFRVDPLALKLPQFFIRNQIGDWFGEADALRLMECDELLGEFSETEPNGWRATVFQVKRF